MFSPLCLTRLLHTMLWCFWGLLNFSSISVPVNSLHKTAITMCATSSNFQYFVILPAKCAYWLSSYFRMNRNYFNKHSKTDISNEHTVFSLWQS
jgi:hypothetical protein